MNKARDMAATTPLISDVAIGFYGLGIRLRLLNLLHGYRDVENSDALVQKALAQVLHAFLGLHTWARFPSTVFYEGTQHVMLLRYEIMHSPESTVEFRLRCFRKWASELVSLVPSHHEAGSW